MIRGDQRGYDRLRKVNIIKDYMRYAEGSCLIELGITRVICTASVEERVPPFLKDTKTGWITAEYGMLPRSAQSRIQRESSAGRIKGRTHEIQRLIGRSLRAVVELKTLGERTILMDCDVIQADGGTRTASITGSFIALVDALRKLKKAGIIDRVPVKDFVAATSVGILEGTPVLDLTYDEDSRAEVDMNVVMTGSGEFIEVQGTAEKAPFTQEVMEQLLSLARKGIGGLIEIQKGIIGEIL